MSSKYYYALFKQRAEAFWKQKFFKNIPAKESFTIMHFYVFNCGLRQNI